MITKKAVRGPFSAMSRACAVALLVLFTQTARAGENSAWEHITDNMGILYFFKPTCPYCREQSGILDKLEKRGWKNLVRVDITQSPQVAEEYGVSVVPSLWLIGNAEGEILSAHISIGLLSEQELLRSIEDVYRAWFGPAI
ncbi:MAG: conjugal transfer protein TraF [Desulfovibrio sp.]|nr:conjugal transfer protein TraF [Desulfovibrio sp.]